MSIGHTCKNLAERTEISNSVSAYIKAGGKVQQLPFGVRQEDKVSYNSHSKTHPPMFKPKRSKKTQELSKRVQA